jgi:hypothetical protein
MHMKVSRDQFEIHGDRLRHAPTGALFWMGETDVVSCEMGPEELKQAAYEAFKLQKARCG